MVALLDVNLLIALAWPNHLHHQKARLWFEQQMGFGWATCPVTQAGFVRVSSNRKVIPEARTPREALSLLRRVTDLPHHVFWSDNIKLAESRFVNPFRLMGYRQVTDAHLLAIALQNAGRLATLDRGVRSILPEGVAFEESVDLVST